MKVTTLALAMAMVLSGGLKPRTGTAVAVDEAVPIQVGSAAPSTVRIGVLHGTTYEVTTIPLDEYVGRVLAGEALPGSAPAAMEALAIAVRTYTAANLGRHRADGFDLCDQTHCQVMRTANESTERAAQATAGQVLLYHGAPATIYYSASCGGRTEVPSAVWPGAEDPPYLPSRPDDGCGGGPPWTAEIGLSDLRRSFAAAGFRGTLKGMAVESHNASGRVSMLSLDGLTPARISGQDLRAAVGGTLGWQYIRSTAFELKRTRDVYRFDGHGSGHGVGMCVIGSANLAVRGQSAPTILEHYFPGLTIGSFAPRAPVNPAPQLSGPAPGPAPAPTARPRTGASPATAGAGRDAPVPAPVAVPGVMVSLPEGEEGERSTLLALVARSRDELSTLLSVSKPSQLTVRIHATTDDYAQATGRPWFTPGAVLNNEVHLPPLAALRDRGVLERTVRRQVVHVLADGILAQRPAWVREGAALYFADSQAGASTAAAPRAACPSDADLLKPISPGALSAAFAAARACFERQVSTGRTWRDVR